MRQVLSRGAVLLVSMALVWGCSPSGDADDPIEPIEPATSEEDEAEDGEVEDGEVEGDVEGAGVTSEELAEPSPDQEAAVDQASDDASTGGVAEEVDITVVPEEITLDYVDAVLAELERLFASAVNEVVATGEMTIEASDLLNSAFSGAELESVFADLIVVAQEPELARDSADIRPNTVEAVSILDAANECLWVETVADLSGV
ncbi:MAG: hypothetical protein ACLFS9_04250, partial [Nitriliruptoraceae bacterium]